MSESNQTNLTQIQDLDIMNIRKDFPILSQKVHDKNLIYLDNASTTQKPQQVIDTVLNFYSSQNSNIHRGVHYLSERATQLYEEARILVSAFINSHCNKEIVFTRGATEAINLVAYGFGYPFIAAGDEIIISGMEHHSNIVPWQVLCKQKNAKLRIIPISDKGDLIFEEYLKLLNEKTKLVSLVHISNSIGTVNPIKKFIKEAHKDNIPVLIDGAQSIQHTKTDVQELDCDFYVFSGHKIYAPSGIGVLYGKTKYLEEMAAYQTGGDMIKSVTFEQTLYNELPHKFEAGTPNIEGALGLATALDYIQSLGIENIKNQEKDLVDYAIERLKQIKGLHIFCDPAERGSVISFILENIHPHDVGTVLDHEGIAIRTGNHCTQPVMQRFNVPATSRISFAFYNTKEEIDCLVEGIYKVIKMFKNG